MEIFTMASLGFAVMLSVKFIVIGRQQPAALWLGMFVLLLAGSLSEFIVKDSPTILSIIGGTYWLFGPVLLFFVRLRINPEYPFNRSDFLHLLPCVAYYALLIGSPKSGLSESDGIADLIMYEAVFIHLLIYFVRSWFTARMAGFRNEFRHRMNSTFVKLLVAAAILLFGSSWIFTNVLIFTATAQAPAFLNFVQLSLSFLILVIALLGAEMPSRPDTEEVY